MMYNDAERLKIVLSLSDPFDYEEFCAACAVVKAEPLPIHEYAQKVGMVMVAIRRWPDIAPADAYMMLVMSNQATTMPTNTTNTTLDDSPIITPPVTRKKCCGGGKIR